MSGIEKVGVIGGGLMGSGITEVCGAAGLEAVNVEVSEAAQAAAEKRVRSSIDRAMAKERITAEAAAATLGNMTFAHDLAALADCDMVIEAAIENEEMKLALFADVAKVLTKPETIIASNTSSLAIVKLAAASGRPDKMVGLHFFNPVPAMKLVEVVPALTTSQRSVDKARAFIEEDLGKVAIVATDRSGFVVNALLVPYMVSAIRMYESGFASKEDIDTGMKLGCGYPMGPLELCDMVGLDTLRSAAASMYVEFKEPHFAPSPLLERMVQAGYLGKKSGRGFYEY